MQALPEDDWAAWSPQVLARKLGAVAGPWYIVGGWALDLWHGRQTRAHGDLEFAVLPEGVAACRAALPDLSFFAARDGALTHVPGPAPQEATQLWGADMAARCWRVDLMVERGTPERWAYKRDPALGVSRSQAVRRDDDGIPYLAPELVLLFKAKHRRPKDEQDFEAALPRLAVGEAAHLRSWLAQCHPGHDWIAKL